MQKVEKYLLDYCIVALGKVLDAVKNTSVSSLIEVAQSGKQDSLFIDVLPENILNMSLIEDYDNNIVLVTEEKGGFNFEEISRAELVVFSDPTDRSKPIKNFIQKNIDSNRINHSSLFRELIDSDRIIEEWSEFATFHPRLSGASCSLTVVKRGTILFSLILNYITQEIFVACSEFTGYAHASKVGQSPASHEFKSWTPIKFMDAMRDDYTSYVSFLAKDYREYLINTNLLDDSFKPLDSDPGGPVRILFLSDLNDRPTGFVFANGEKIGEWLGWLAYCKYSNKNLVAYSVYPGTTFAKDNIIMTPSPPYSILELRGRDLFLNYDKLRYFENPSRYREMIVIAHKDNHIIRGRVESKKSRLLF